VVTTAPPWHGPPPLAVVVDLDDTLYPQAAYLAGAAADVGAAAAAAGLDGDRVHAALLRELAAGSDRGGTIDRALLAAGIPAGEVAALVSPLVAAFTAHAPASLPPYPGAAEALARLGEVVPVGCLTDGNPAIQAAKLAATGLAPLLTAVLVTDSLGGRAARKPASDGLRVLAARLGVPADRVLVVGDRPGKDVAVAAAVGARAVRVRQGEYASAPDEPPAWAVTADFPAAAALALAAATAGAVLR
jgi:putative hydrolase of the HAD superfamily